MCSRSNWFNHRWSKNCSIIFENIPSPSFQFEIDWGWLTSFVLPYTSTTAWRGESMGMGGIPAGTTSVSLRTRWRRPVEDEDKGADRYTPTLDPTWKSVVSVPLGGNYICSLHHDNGTSIFLVQRTSVGNRLLPPACSCHAEMGTSQVSSVERDSRRVEGEREDGSRRVRPTRRWPVHPPSTWMGEGNGRMRSTNAMQSNW